MTIEVEIDGTMHIVSIDGGRSAGLQPCVLRVTIDGSAMDIELTGLGDGRMSLLVGDGASRRAVDALVAEKGAAGELSIVLANTSIDARVFGKGRVWGARRRVAVGEAAPAGTNEIVAPMPGRIARVLVAPGDAVKPRQPLVVVEAMKMENELRARAASQVKEVLVTEGTLVEAGRVLVVLEH